MTIYVAKEYCGWQINVLNILNKIKYEIIDDAFVTHEDWRKHIKENESLSKEIKKKSY